MLNKTKDHCVMLLQSVFRCVTSIFFLYVLGFISVIVLSAVSSQVWILQRCEPVLSWPPSVGWLKSTSPTLPRVCVKPANTSRHQTTRLQAVQTMEVLHKKYHQLNQSQPLWFKHTVFFSRVPSRGLAFTKHRSISQHYWKPKNHHAGGSRWKIRVSPKSVGFLSLSSDDHEFLHKGPLYKQRRMIEHVWFAAWFTVNNKRFTVKLRATRIKGRVLKQTEQIGEYRCC